MGELTNSFEPKGIRRPPRQWNNETLTNRKSNTVQRFVATGRKENLLVNQSAGEYWPDLIVNQTDIYLHEIFERGTFVRLIESTPRSNGNKTREKKERGGVEWRKEDTKVELSTSLS